MLLNCKTNVLKKHEYKYIQTCIQLPVISNWSQKHSKSPRPSRYFPRRCRDLLIPCFWKSNYFFLVRVSSGVTPSLSSLKWTQITILREKEHAFKVFQFLISIRLISKNLKLNKNYSNLLFLSILHPFFFYKKTNSSN